MLKKGADEQWKRAASRIKNSFKDRGDQERLAEATKIQPGTLSRYLKGLHTPDVVDAFKIAKALHMNVAELLGEPQGPESVHVLPSIAAGLREIASTATRLEELISGAAKLEPKQRVALGPTHERIRLTLAPPIADADEPRAIEETEVPVVAWAAAGTGDVEQIETGETAMVLNPIARDVFAGKGFVAKVSGESMEPRLHDGELVYFEFVPGSDERRVHDGQVVYVIIDGRPRIKIYKFDGGTLGRETRENIRFVSMNSDKLTHETIYITDPLRQYQILGIASKSVSNLKAERLQAEE